MGCTFDASPAASADHPKAKRRWKPRKFVSLKSSNLDFPAPLSSKTISHYADTLLHRAGLEHLSPDIGIGATLDPEHVLENLISNFDFGDEDRTRVHLQVLGDGFRALKEASIVSVGFRLLSETERADNSFTALAAV